MKVKLLSRVRLLAISRPEAYQAPPSMGFSRQEYWSGVPLPSPKIILLFLKSKILFVRSVNGKNKPEKMYPNFDVQNSALVSMLLLVKSNA